MDPGLATSPNQFPDLKIIISTLNTGVNLQFYMRNISTKLISSEEV